MLKIIPRLSDMDIEKLFQVYCDRQTSDAEEAWKKQNALYDYLAQVFFRTSGAYYAVWEAYDSYVSALRLEPYKDGMLLSALETAPQYRNCGFATELMQQALEQVCQPVYAHVDRNNKPSYIVHRRCGFQKIMDYAVYLDGSISCSADTLCRWKAD